MAHHTQARRLRRVLLARVLRLGFLADFLSRTVLTGFLTGLASKLRSGS
jgi:MFS superfamily sulfate permease-like transporter